MFFYHAHMVHFIQIIDNLYNATHMYHRFTFSHTPPQCKCMKNSNIYMVAQNSGAALFTLTAHIFKMPQPIYMTMTCITSIFFLIQVSTLFLSGMQTRKFFDLK